MPKRLIEHRQAIAQNPVAYTHEMDRNMDRLVTTLIPHLKKYGLAVTYGRHHTTLAKIITLLFEAQQQRPIFHVEGTELPLCWNGPADWDKDYIKYEWGHLRSKNQNPAKTFGIENLALYSARCNNHIQSSMNIEELMIYGGILAQRITAVLTSRRILFASTAWVDTVASLT